MCKCPYCKEEFNYTRSDTELLEKEIIVRCYCNICEKDFDEIFIYSQTIKR